MNDKCVGMCTYMYAPSHPHKPAAEIAHVHISVECDSTVLPSSHPVNIKKPFNIRYFLQFNVILQYIKKKL